MSRQPVVRLSALALEPFRHGRSYQSDDARLGDRLGLTKIGATYIEVPPGKSSCPYHVHHVWDELFVILEGHGQYRFGEEIHQVGPGDVLGAPCGDVEFAHKLTNTGTTKLKYLAISSLAECDVCEYPDSGKLGLGSRIDTERPFRFVGRLADRRDYWDGEPDEPSRT